MSKIKFSQFKRENIRYIVRKTFLTFIFFQQFFCACNSKNNNSQKSNDKAAKKTTLNTDIIKVKDTTIWAKEEIPFPLEPSKYFSYQVIFTKGDSVIDYAIESEQADSCIPIFLDLIRIKGNKRDISISFEENNKINTLTSNYKNIDFSKVDDITIHFDDKSFLDGIMLEEKSEVDSFLRVEFGIKRRVKK